MTVENTNSVTMTAGAAVTKGRYVKMSGGDVIHATAGTDGIIGVAAETAASGAALNVYLFGGKVEVEASAAISAGDNVTATTDGKAVTTVTATDRVAGISLTAAAADGEYITVLHQPLSSHLGA